MAHEMAEAGIDQNVVFSFFQSDATPPRNRLNSDKGCDIQENTRRVKLSIYDAKITVIHVVEALSPFAQSMVEDIVGTEKLETLQKEKESQIIKSIEQRLDEFCPSNSLIPQFLNP